MYFLQAPLAAPSDAPALLVLSKAGTAGLQRDPRAFPEQDWISPPHPSRMGRDAHGGEVFPSWKAHLACQWAPFLGAAAAKRRQIRKTEV